MSSTANVRLGRWRARLSGEAWFVVAITIAFIAFSVWWLLYDQRLPGGGDPGRHLSTTLGYADRLADFDLISIVKYNGDGGFFYPPLVRVIGAIPAAMGLRAEDWGTILVNLVFVPMLAAGCYLTGRDVFNRFAGALAALFALGTPMILSLFHVFLLDAPLAGVTALTVWALLASDRFALRRLSVLVGALAGVGLMVKTTAPIYLAGPVLVMLIGGGWRHWRNWALAAVAMLVVAAPWHLVHLNEMSNLTGQAPTGIVSGVGANAAVTEDFLDRLAVYGWSAINLQYFVPLSLLFLAGVVYAIRDVPTRRHLPEVLAGLVVSYLVFALAISFRDPRYTLPMVVFVAVIATGWIAVAKNRALRGAGLGLLVAAVALNVTAATTTSLESTKLHTPGDDPNPGDPNQPGVLTVYDDAGYLVGAPRPDPFWQDLLGAAEADGVKSAEITVREAPHDGTDHEGFYVLAKQHGIRETTFVQNRPKHPDLLIDTWWFTPDSYWIHEKGLPRPCGAVPDGTTAPAGSDAVPLHVAVRRRVGDRYVRWCDF